MAGAASHNDFGINFVRHVHKLAGVPYHATSWELRGFSWWVGDYRQRIWADLGVGDDEDSMAFRICTATDFVHEVDASSAALIEKVTEEARAASTSALVYDPQDHTLRHWTTFTVDDAVGNWVFPLVIGSAYSQLAAVNAARDDIEKLFGGKRDQNNRPVRGPASCQHERVKGWQSECAEEGRNQSAWASSAEFGEAVGWLQRSDIGAVLVDEGLTVEFPFATDRDSEPSGAAARAVRFEMDSSAHHPLHGSGLATRLTLPLALPNELAHRLCAVLNLLETREFTRSCLIGSWCVDGDAIAFASFIPNILYAPGMVANLALAACARTQWVADKLGHEDHRQAAVELVAPHFQDVGGAAESAADFAPQRRSGLFRRILGRA